MATSTSLQIPSLDSPIGSSSRNHYHPQYHPSPPSATAMSASARPVSVAVASTPNSSSNTTSRKQRASHSVTSSQQQHNHHSNTHSRIHHDENQEIDLTDHPAVIAYRAAHPRRTIPKFGPYLLLQTLGEGEFGKVKLGLHTSWGEEVAVKLIRRGNIDSTVRMSKVEREIEVLKDLKHPNIVRLYDVIETDKYIGIILEYASGGELFDHILAHRYLREKDAAKLFSQLISGVWYIHQKKIVHRDLKLENLLLDRHRNVIITDFGFANRFEHRSDDLMQTSCGSPCYAAPELVISEGLYVGSAVDIWSCGVILYAMLAGYLPFDDDPANPDGDNINLLYKYIVNTPLSFPDYISTEARELLGMMLVPDPVRRTTLEGVMRHRWLSAYAVDLPNHSEAPIAFGKTVAELEKIAMEQHHQKRLAYQKQMKAAAAAANNNNPNLSTMSMSAALGSSGGGPVGRSQSHRPDALGSGIPTGTSQSAASGSRSKSTQPDLYYETSMDQSHASATSPVVLSSSTSKKTPTVLVNNDDDPFAPVTASTKGASTNASLSPDEARDTKKHHRASGSGGGSTTGGGFRHTIQVEYDEPNKTRNSKRDSEDRERRKSRDRSGSQSQKPDQPTSPSRTSHAGGSASATSAVPTMPTTSATTASSHSRRASQGSVSKPLPPSPGLGNVSATPSSYRASPGKSSTMPAFVAAANAGVHAAENGASLKDTTPTKTRPVLPAVRVDQGQSQQQNTPITPSAMVMSPNADGDRGSQSSTASVKEKEKGHKKGRSSVDRLGLGKIFGNSNSNGSSTPVVPAVSNGADGLLIAGRVPSEGSAVEGGVSGEEGKEEEASKTSKEGKKSRRNTLTVMVKESIRNRTSKSKTASTPIGGGASAANGGSDKEANGNVKDDKERDSLKGVATLASPSDTLPVNGSLSAVQSSFGNVTRTDAELGGPSMRASTGRAKGVMQWFRTKSKGGGGRELDFEASAQIVNPPTEQDVILPPVQVFVTTPTSSRSPPVIQTNVSATGHPQRTASTATDTSFSTPSLVTRFRNSVTVGGSSSHRRESSSKRDSHAAAATAVASGHAPQPGHGLRIHHGAVDQTTITTGQPPDVMKHVREVIEGMGVEIQVESEYKYRCIRAKRKKGAVGASAGSALPAAGGAVQALGNVNANAGGGQGGAGNGSLAAITIVGSAASNGVDKRGLPLPQSSLAATGGMLRGLLMRRQSSQVSANGMSSQPSLPFDDDNVAVVNEPLMMSSASCEPAYGDPTQDAGDEVRFSVELTRLDRLNDTYSLDIRRLKGNLRSYKFLYDTLRQRADLRR